LDWIRLCSVLRPRQHSIGYMGDGFYRSPNQQYQSTEGVSCKGKQPQKRKENTNYTYAHTHTQRHTNTAYTNKHSKSPSLQLYRVTRGRLPQRAGLPGLNGDGTAAAVPSGICHICHKVIPAL